MLSCNTGEGHNSTAKAIQDVLKARGVECEIVDVLACLSPGFPNLCATGTPVCINTPPSYGM